MDVYKNIRAVLTEKKVQDGSIIYAADSGASDAYAITLSPVPSAYTNGMVVHFKANTANTGAATLNVNSLGAKTIKKNYNEDLADNDIKAGQYVSVIYDGTNFQMLSPVANIAKNSYSYVRKSNATTTSSSLVNVPGMLFNGAEANKKYKVSISAWIWNSESGYITLRLASPTNSLISGSYWLTINSTSITVTRVERTSNYSNIRINHNSPSLAQWDVLIEVGDTSGDIKLQFSNQDYTSYVGTGSIMTVEETL